MKTIMICDDDAVMASVLEFVLKQINGVEVKVINKYREVLNAAEKISPALILLDLMFPLKKDGLGVLRELKERAGTRNIPVIMISGVETRADIDAAFEQGAVDYIKKPFDVTVVKDKVMTFLR